MAAAGRRRRVRGLRLVGGAQHPHTRARAAHGQGREDVGAGDGGQGGAGAERLLRRRGVERGGRRLRAGQQVDVHRRGSGHTTELVHYDSLHHQPTALVSYPNQSTLFVPQAASSLNTSRPLLSFSLRRHSHRTGHVKKASISYIKNEDVFAGLYFYLTHFSGGRSGGENLAIG